MKIRARAKNGVRRQVSSILPLPVNGVGIGQTQSGGEVRGLYPCCPPPRFADYFRTEGHWDIFPLHLTNPGKLQSQVVAMRTKLQLQVVASVIGQKKLNHLIIPKMICSAWCRSRGQIVMETRRNLDKKPLWR